MGVDLETPTLPEPDTTLLSAYHDSLTTALRTDIIDHIEDPYRRYRAEQAWRTAQFLRNAQRYLPAIHAAEIEEIARITGNRAAGHPEALTALDTFVTTAGPDADETLLRFFFRQQYRMEALMAGAVGRSEGRHFSDIRPL